MGEMAKKSLKISRYFDMRLGIIVRSDNSGLGIQTRALYNYLKPDKVLLIDSTPFNGRHQHPEWYENPIISDGLPDEIILTEFLKNLDIIITCEVPYNQRLYGLAKKMRVKTVLQPNAELNDLFNRASPTKPTALFLPSPWRRDETARLGIPMYLCPPPLDFQPRYKPVKKEQGKLKVLHVVGRKAAYDRNGTEIVNALPKIDGVELVIHDQSQNEVEDQREIYEKDYHVVILPRRYGGLCLPMYESLGYGLPVLMTDCAPNDQVLPGEWLFNAKEGKKVRTKYVIPTYDAQVDDIVRLLKEFKDMDQDTYDQEVNKAHSLYEQYKEGWSQWPQLLKQVHEGDRR